MARNLQMHRVIIACILVALMAKGAWAEGETAPCGEASGSDTDYTITPYNVKNNELFNMVVIGDSIAWGNGLNRKNKYSFLVADWLQEKLNRPIKVTVYAHSGATITGESGKLIDPNLNSKSPTLTYQAKNIKNKDDVDLILVSGGINDVGIQNIMDANTPVETINSLSESIKDPMTNLLTYLLDETDSKIIVTGYYPLITEESKVEIQDRAVAGLLALASKKTISQSERALISAIANPTAGKAEAAWYLIEGIANNIDNIGEDDANLRANSDTFYAISCNSLEAAADAADKSRNRVIFVDPIFERKNAYRASNSFLWELNRDGLEIRTNDFQYQERAELVEKTYGLDLNPLDLDLIKNAENKINPIAHPNRKGAAKYADAIKAVIDGKGLSWLDNSYPTIQSFQVTPQSSTIGESFTIDYTVSDTGGSGLKQVELWRKDETSDWQEIKLPNTLSGETGTVSGSFTDSPSVPGMYWYGVHVVDNAGNWNDERNSNSDGQPSSFKPVEVNVGKTRSASIITDIGRWTEMQRLIHAGGVCSVSFSPDGRKLATGSIDNTARIWDVETGMELQKLVHGREVYSVSFSPDGRKLATGCVDNIARIWDAETGAELKELIHEREVYSVSFSPDGSELATGSPDKSARIWNTETGVQLKRLVHNDTVWAVSFSPDGRSLATACADDTVRIWDVAKGVEMQKFTFAGSMLSVSFSPDGSKLATGSFDNIVRISDAVTGEELRRLMLNDEVHSLSFSYNGNMLATASDDNTSVIWDVDTGAELQKLIHNDWVRAISFSSDGARLATGCFDSVARIWDVSNANK